MGHGWKEVSRSEISREKCSCGEGFNVTYRIIEESDYSMENRTDKEVVNECNNHCDRF